MSIRIGTTNLATLCAILVGITTLTACGTDSSGGSLEGLRLTGKGLSARHHEGESSRQVERGDDRGGREDRGGSDDRGRRRGGDRRDGDARRDRNRIKSPGDQASVVGTIVDLIIEKTRVGDDDEYAFSATGLPAGLTIDQVSGKISGTVTATAGVYAVEVTAEKAGSTGADVDRYTVQFNWSVTAQ